MTTHVVKNFVRKWEYLLFFCIDVIIIETEYTVSYYIYETLRKKWINKII